ncbi:MAG: ornithine cyclodeaminase family protein [bacterium]|nr:MAG: ornithine cyclodeaminase family protein [bacterium]
MLCLSEQDILHAVTFADIMATVERAMIIYEEKSFHMPLRMHAEYMGNMLLLMPCLTSNTFGTKLVTLFPDNTNRNLPVLFGTMILNDGETGEPLALLNGSKLTALRTGAVGGVGIRYLAPENTTKLGIIGAGVQGFHQVLFACTERKISDVFIFDQIAHKVPSFMENLSRKLPQVKFHQAESTETILKESELIITATNSEKPVLPNQIELLRGKHFVGIGSYKPNMREFPDALFQILDQMFIDTEHAKEESGDVIDPVKNEWIEKDQMFTFGKLIQKKIESKAETTLFKSVGMALFDVVVSELIYEKAVEKGLGQEVVL